MQWNLGLQRLGLLVVTSLGFGVIAQLSWLGERRQAGCGLSPR
jgi:hypothetical protein